MTSCNSSKHASYGFSDALYYGLYKVYMTSAVTLKRAESLQVAAKHI